MSYFNEIADYATYSGHEADFHFTYNANSGGGRAVDFMTKTVS